MVDATVWKLASIVADFREINGGVFDPAFHIEIPKKEALTRNVIHHY